MNDINKRGTALVTGASSGIGAVYADRLAHRGYDLILVARDQIRLERVADRLCAATGVGIEVLAANLTDPFNLHGVERRLRQDTGITMLVNNAGMSVKGGLLGADIDCQQTMIELNVIAPTRLSAAAASAFVARRHGTIVNLSSALALVPELFNGAYSGTKAYMLNLSLAMHAEFGAAGLRVQAVLPGAVRTEIWQRAGIDLAGLPDTTVMEAEELVDAALRGLDCGELVTILSLPDAAGWERLNDARLALQPELSHKHSAARYRAAG